MHFKIGTCRTAGLDILHRRPLTVRLFGETERYEEEGAPPLRLLHDHEAAVAGDGDFHGAALVGAGFAGAEEGGGGGLARLQRQGRLLAVELAGGLRRGGFDRIGIQRIGTGRATVSEYSV